MREQRGARYLAHEQQDAAATGENANERSPDVPLDVMRAPLIERLSVESLIALASVNGESVAELIKRVA